MADPPAWPYSWISAEVVAAAGGDCSVVLTRAHKLISSLEDRVRFLEGSNENEKLQHEQLYNELERRWREAAEQIAQQDAVIKSSHLEVEKARSIGAQMTQAESSLRNSLQQAHSHSIQLQNKIETLEASEREHLVLLEQKTQQADQLRKELAVASEQERSLRAEKHQLEQKLYAVDADLIQAKYQLGKLQTESSEQTKAKEWLETQLAQRSEQLTTLKAQASTIEADLREQVATLRHEAAHKDQLLVEATAASTHASVERDRLRAELASFQQSSVQAQLQLEAKLESQQRLIELHASKSESSQRLLAEANAREEASKQIVLTLREQHEVAIQKESARASNLQQQLDSTVQELASVRGQLMQLMQSSPDSALILTEEQLQQRIESIVSMDPQGKKNLQMLISAQQKYELASEALKNERAEKNRLVGLIQQIEEDLAAKEPLMERNRREYERAKAEQAQLSQSLEQSLAQNEQLRSQLELLKRDSDSIKKENDDLSRQICVLLKECQQLQNQQGGAPHLAEPETAVDSDPNTALLTFRDIRELQHRNRQLMRLVQELSAEENETTKQSTQQLLETALAELRQVSQTRERQEEKLRHYAHVIEAQKMLLQEQESKHQQLVSQVQRFGESAVTSDALPLVLAPSHPSSLPNVLDDSARVAELKVTLDSLRDELHQCRETNMSLRLELASEKAKVESELQRSTSTARVISSLEEQCRDLRARSSEQAKQFAELEKQNAALMRDRTQARDQASSLEHQLNSEKIASRLAEESAQRYLKDLATLREERTARDQLMNQMQTILAERQSTLDSIRQQAESMQKEAAAQLTTVKEDLQRTRELLHSERQDLQLLRASSAQQLELAHSRANALTSELKERDQLITSLRNSVAVIQQQLDAAQADLAQLRADSTPSNDLPPDALPSGLLDANTSAAAANALLARRRGQELRVVQSQLIAKDEELKALREHVDSYRKIATASDETLRQLEASMIAKESEANKAIEDITRRLRESETTVSSLQEELSRKTHDLDDALARAISAESSFDEKTAHLQEQLRFITSERDIACSKQHVSDAERDRLSSALKELQANYHRHVRELAEAFERNSALEAARDALQQQLDVEHNELVSTRNREAALSTQLTLTVSALEKDRDAERQRAEDALFQVTSLLRQVDALTQSISNARLLPTLGTDSSSAEIAVDSERLNYLRNEVEIHQVQISVLRQDLEHMKAQADHFRQQAESYRNLLSEEQQKRSTINNSSEFTERMSLLEQVNILRESNTTLRQTSEQTSRKLQESEARLAALELEKGPLLLQLKDAQQVRDSYKVECDEAKESARMWQQRCTDIIARYQHIDPIEHDALKTKVQELIERVAQLDGELIATKALLDKAKAEANGTELEIIRQKLEEKTRKFSELMQAAKNVEKSKKEADLARSKAEQALSKLEQEKALLEEQLRHAPPPQRDGATASPDDLAILEARVHALSQQLSEMEGEKSALERDVDDLTGQTNNMQQKILELEATLEKEKGNLEKEKLKSKKLYSYYMKHSKNAQPETAPEATPESTSVAASVVTPDSSAQLSESAPVPTQVEQSETRPSTVQEVPPPVQGALDASIPQAASSDVVPVPMETATAAGTTAVESPSTPAAVQAIEVAPVVVQAVAQPPLPINLPGGAPKKGKQLPVRGGGAKKMGKAAAAPPPAQAVSSDLMSPEAMAKRSRKFAHMTPASETDKQEDIVASAPKRQKTSDGESSGAADAQ